MAYGDGTYITNKSGTITLQKYYGTDVNGKKIYKKFTAKNKTAAKEKARKFEEALVDVNNLNNSKMLFVDYIKRWAEIYKKILLRLQHIIPPIQLNKEKANWYLKAELIFD